MINDVLLVTLTLEILGWGRKEPVGAGVGGLAGGAGANKPQKS